MEERLQKLIAAAGLCSRRAAEEKIAAGRVTVNGKTARLGDRADGEHDQIAVDGRPLKAKEPLVYLLLNKPRGYVTTLHDEQGRPTVADLLRDVSVRVFPVGRLDYQSEGLLLMTNDGELMQHLIHPSFEISKTYLVTVSGEVERAAERLSAVTSLEGEAIRPALTKLLDSDGKTARLSITIHEGKNRQIRRMCLQCGLTVKRLQRIQEHTLKLGNLPSGKWRFLSESEIRSLKNEA